MPNENISANSGASAELGASTTSLPVARVILSTKKTFIHP